MKQKTFIKYLTIAIISFIIDITIFSISNLTLKSYLSTKSILISTIMARIISSFTNYLLNRNTVFQNNSHKLDFNTLTKYYILVVIQMLVSGTLVTILYQNLKIYESLIKIPVELILFIVNYHIQKKYIFNKTN